tara:strand:+ start:1395 stop:1637 length:243 start_codon:yes stop_codon:yes gene_type:complete
VRRLVAKGPPVYLSDEQALPLPEGDTHIELVWFASDNREESAKLKGAVEGEEREKLWAAQRETLRAMEEAEKNAPKEEDK